MEQMGGVHKKFVGHVSLMYRELLKAMKSEMSAQAAAQQAATEQLLAAALEAQKQQVGNRGLQRGRWQGVRLRHPCPALPYQSASRQHCHD
jgi:hypothetical protein